MGEWSEWSDWLREGFYISYRRDGIRYYEHIIERDFAHYEYDWPETIDAGTESGPYIPADLEITRGYDQNNNTNNLWQVIFGIKGQAYIYIELPTDTHRHGIPKRPKPGTDLREVSHFEEWMSPFKEPSFITEHFMMRPETMHIAFDAYNPQAIDLPDVRLNIFIAKLVTERIGTEEYGKLVTPLMKTPDITSRLEARWMETLEKLYKRTMPFRPITIMPVTAPAVAPAGE